MEGDTYNSHAPYHHSAFCQNLKSEYENTSTLHLFYQLPAGQRQNLILRFLNNHENATTRRESCFDTAKIQSDVFRKGPFLDCLWYS